MPIVRFTGKILPRFVHVTSSGHPSVHWKNDELDLHADIDSAIIDNELTITCNTNGTTTENFYSLASQVDLIAEGLTSLLCFETGLGISYILEKCELPDGMIVDVQWYEPSVENLSVSVATNQGMGAALSLVLRDRELLLAVRDLADSIQSSYSASINLARAVESIRHYFDSQDAAQDRSKGWSAMRSALHLTRECLDEIMAASVSPRHGKRTKQQAHDSENGVRAWKIVDRFIQYRLRGDQALSDTEFPLLD
jgi:hypothetical protein